MLSARISTYTNTLILPKPKLYSRSFSDHFSWSGPAPTEVGADVDYAAEVGDDCDCCWDAHAGPGPVAPQFAQHYIASHSSLFKVESLAQLEELISRRRKVEGSIPWYFLFFFCV
jgi:hypothetical protein